MAFVNKKLSFIPYRKVLFVFFVSLLATACISIPSPEQRRQNAIQLASNAGWYFEVFSTQDFKLASFRSSQQAIENGVLSIYIEGDGLAWITSSIISHDPTPISPIGLMLALQHQQQGNAVVYLGRPCQYLKKQNKQCFNKYWTSHRFSPEVIQATNSVIDKLKIETNAKQIQLIGYSGGGAVAALVAARRDDVTLLITVAGNLDHKSWSEYHQISPLTGSLNPTKQWQKLQTIPQLHFSGGNDHIVPPETITHYKSYFQNNAIARFRIIPDFDHACCWEKKWPELLNEALLFSDNRDN